MIAKNYKVILIKWGLGFLVLLVVIVWQGFPMLHRWTDNLSVKVSEIRNQLLQLEGERESFERGREDLKNLENYVYQPSNLFTTDVDLVEELKVMERLATESKVEIDFSVSGTVGEAVQAKTISELYLVPFRLDITGQFSDIVHFMERLEKAKFVMHSQSMNSVYAGSDGVTTSLIGTIYLRK